MAMPPHRPKPKDLAKRMKRRWRIVLIRSKGEVLGTVEAAAQGVQRRWLRSNSSSMNSSGVAAVERDRQTFVARWWYCLGVGCVSSSSAAHMAHLAPLPVSGAFSVAARCDR